MATFNNSANLNKYVAPVLLKSVNEVLMDNFTKFFGSVSAGARTSDGVNLNMIVNQFEFETGVGVDEKFGEPVKIADKKTVMPWTNYTSKVYRVSDEDIRKLTYAKETAVRQTMIEALSAKIAQDSLCEIAPKANGAKTPVISGTGANKSTSAKRITKKDILSLKEKYVGSKHVLVLCKTHLIDLLNDDLDTGDKVILSNLREGQVSRMFGFDITVNEKLNIRYTPTGTKKAMTDAVAATDKQASVIIEKQNTLFHNYNLGFNYIGKEKDMTYKVPHSRLRIYGEYIGNVIRDNEYRGAIIDGKV